MVRNYSGMVRLITFALFRSSKDYVKKDGHYSWNQLRIPRTIWKKLLQKNTIKISKVKDYVENRQEIQLKTIKIERDRIKGQKAW